MEGKVLTMSFVKVMNIFSNNTHQKWARCDSAQFQLGQVQLRRLHRSTHMRFESHYLILSSLDLKSGKMKIYDRRTKGNHITIFQKKHVDVKLVCNQRIISISL